MNKSVYLLCIAFVLPLGSFAQSQDPNLTTPVVGAIGCVDCNNGYTQKKKKSDLSQVTQEILSNLKTSSGSEGNPNQSK